MYLYCTVIKYSFEVLLPYLSVFFHFILQPHYVSDFMYFVDYVFTTRCKHLSLVLKDLLSFSEVTFNRTGFMKIIECWPTFLSFCYFFHSRQMYFYSYQYVKRLK